MFKVNEIVAVCYDGKLTRAVEGKVLFTTPKGLRITVSFKPWANEEVGFVELHCQRRPWGYSGFLQGVGENLVMRSLDIPGDYYRVFSLEEITSQGYKVDPYDRPAYMG